MLIITWCFLAFVEICDAYKLTKIFYTMIILIHFFSNKKKINETILI